jgi:hypothetical protein
VATLQGCLTADEASRLQYVSGVRILGTRGPPSSGHHNRDLGARQRPAKPLLIEFEATGTRVAFRHIAPAHEFLRCMVYRQLIGNIGAVRCPTCRSVLDASELDFGAGAGTRTPDPRFKSSPRTPQDASSGLLLNSVLRISTPRGSSNLPGLAIQIGYTSPGLERSRPRRARTRNGEAPSPLAVSGGCLART